MNCFVRLSCIGLLLAVGPIHAAEQSEAERTALAVEALSRLQGVNIEQNPRLKETVLKVLERTRGTPNFVKLVQQFKLKGQEQGLLDVASKNSGNETGVEAMRLLLAEKNDALLQQALASTNRNEAIRVAEAIGNAGDKEATLRLLLPVMTDEKNELGLRKQAVRSLAQSSEGAAAVLGLAKKGQLAADLKFTASSELNRVRWPEIRNEAAKVLALPEGRNAQALPPLAELVKLKGDAANGAKVYSSINVGCNTCHQVKGQGIDFGPDLSEIGSKLGKDALFEAILDPSSGISFGYEAWQLDLKSGDEAFGLLASETADEIALKAVGGIVTRYKKSEVKGRTQMKLSVMPAGLQQNMTTQELVDLVEYLFSLKKN